MSIQDEGLCGHCGLPRCGSYHMTLKFIFLPAQAAIAQQEGWIFAFMAVQ